MTPNEIIRSVLSFLVLIIFKVLILRQVVLFDTAFCFLYIAAILFLPYEIDSVWLLIICFATGLLIDSFYNTFGVHAAATVLVGYVRPFVLRAQFAQKNVDSRLELTLSQLGFVPFLAYTGSLVLLHHAALFFIETNNIGLFLPTVLKTVASALFTLVAIFLMQLFSRR